MSKHKLVDLKDFNSKKPRFHGPPLIKVCRASDPPPGNIVMWRGLSRLTDIQIGVDIGAGNMGN